MARIIPVILCGGSGTRMWPASRQSLPKQFIPLFDNRSTFQDAAQMVSDEAVFERPIVLTNADYRFKVSEQLSELGLAAEIVLEPEGRDSAPGSHSLASTLARAAPTTS